MLKKRTYITLLILLLATTGFFTSGQASASAAIFGDVNGDSKADVIDFSIILSHYSQAGDRSKGDLNSSGLVDGADLNVLRTYYNKTVAETEPSGTLNDKLYVNKTLMTPTAYTYVYGSAKASWRAGTGIPYSTGSKLYGNDTWRPTTGNTGDAAQLKKIADQPTAMWLGNYSGQDAKLDEALKQAKLTNTVPVFAVYYILYRDNGLEASGGGGAPTLAAYKSYIDHIAEKIGSTESIIIIEPDGLTGGGDDPTVQKTGDRWAAITYATKKLANLPNNPNTRVYTDAGTYNWKTTDRMATRLSGAGVEYADGISLNVSNTQSTKNVTEWGKSIATALATKTYTVKNADGTVKYAADGVTPVKKAFGYKPLVIDTSRNGLGSWAYPVGTLDSWCNPPGRALGIAPTRHTGVANVDAYLWVKIPGERDGVGDGTNGSSVCTRSTYFRTKPGDTGTDSNFWLEYALMLAYNTAKINDPIAGTAK